MAVDDYLFRETDALVLPSKTLYPLSIPVAHYQLRHYISCEGQDVLYYASGQDVYALNAATRKRTHLATLPFETRCTASGHGWLCLGGEDDGHFAAIKLDGGPSLAADVDALLPLELGNRPLARPSAGPSTPTVKLERIGEEIVNSISIHKLAGQGEGAEDEVVAVLTNNDKTVRVYCLTHGLEEAVLDLPFPMNHASISPNGDLMVAVGDYHQAFFFERVRSKQTPPSSKADARVGATSSDWSNLCVAQLHVPNNSTTTGYFTTAWSPSGKLCAVGSECGYITVFDTDLLATCEFGEDAVVQVVRSTRPDTTHGPGAVRTMCFSPQPWDLLIWSEDQARVCVADLRAGLLARQVLNLDTKEEGINKVEAPLVDTSLERSDSPATRDIARLEELSAEADLINRHRRALASAANDTSAALDVVGEFMNAVLQRRRHAQVVESDNDPHGLTAQERSILEALRTREHRDELNRERERIASIPRSINYPGITGAASGRAQRQGASQNDFPSLSDTRSTDSSSNVALPSLGSLRDFLRDRSERERESGLYVPPFQPRRQASVVLTSGRSATDEPSATPGRSSSTTPARGLGPSDTAWRTIEAAMARSPEPTSSSVRPAASTSATSAPRHMDPLVEMGRLRQLARARERVRNMQNARAFDEYGIGLLRRGGTAGRWNPSSGVRTAGLAMSADGRKLYAGTEEGIFEFEIDVRGRKGWGAVQPR